MNHSDAIRNRIASLWGRKEELPMLNLLKKNGNWTYTENGALAHLSTGSDCLDLFATIGALRRENDAKIIARFDRAWAEDPDLAMKTVFFARDIRGGLGERRVFRTILHHIGDTYTRTAKKNIAFIAEYGRFDDLLALMGTRSSMAVLAYIKKQFEADMRALENGENVSLLGKWLPSVNTSDEEAVRKAKRIARSLGLSDKQYRQSLSALRKEIGIIENSLRERVYSFDYSKQPSKAMLKYRNAFFRADGKRYRSFLEDVLKGKAKLNASTLFPYEIVSPLLGRVPEEQERLSLDAMWKSQDDFTNDENALVVVDGSSSMYCGANPLPASVALSLGIYFAERNKGAFHNHFITFSHNPRLVEIKGADIMEKVRYCEGFNEVANTDLQRVFELILGTAIDNDLPQSDLPETLYIISDMEFDYCMNNADVTNFQCAKDLFETFGYKLPRVVFWNVASRNQQHPVTMNEQGVALVSGASPRVFSMLKTGWVIPMEFMLDTLNAKRYSVITA